MRRYAETVNRTRLARRKLREWAVAAVERLQRACGKSISDRTGLERPITDRLTNWQRCQWARAGYPGLAHGQIDEARVEPFLRLRHPNVARARRELDKMLARLG